MRFVEDVSLSGVRMTHDGYMVADVKCARSGIQQYAGWELGKPAMDVVNVFRPEAAVFSKDSLQTFPGKPVTDNHPDEAVTSHNWKDYAVGSIGEDVLRDGEHIRVPIVLMDQGIIDKVKNGQREISMGYDMELRWETGQAPDGTEYHAVMDNLRMNHLAVVKTARAGHECRIGDASNWGAAPLHIADKKGSQMADKLRQVMVDGIPVETTDAGAAVIEKLTNDKKAAEQSLSDANQKHETAIAAKDKELAEKDAKIADLEKKVLDDAALDAKVQDRAKLVADASKLAKDADFNGLSDADIRKTAVAAVRGEDAVKDKSQAYIDAAFDIALEAAGSSDDDPVRQALISRDTKTQANDNGQSAYEKRIADAWKTKKEA
jgi:hypothetical protein